MPTAAFPENLKLLHEGEEELFLKSAAVISADARLLLHLHIIESAMDMLDIFRQFPTDDEDLKVTQVLGMRMFNAFASSLKLMLTGYYQNSALIMRDILETVFLLDLFRTDRQAITRWRMATKQLDEFRPVQVRKYLDERDGFTEKKRAAMYKVFSELAGHPSMQSVAMLRPKGMDARNGPFVDPTALEAVLSEMGRLAVQAGEIIDAFFSPDWLQGYPARKAFVDYKLQWISEFYDKPAEKVATGRGDRT